MQPPKILGMILKSVSCSFWSSQVNRSLQDHHLFPKQLIYTSYLSVNPPGEHIIHRSHSTTIFQQFAHLQHWHCTRLLDACSFNFQVLPSSKEMVQAGVYSRGRSDGSESRSPVVAVSSNWPISRRNNGARRQVGGYSREQEDGSAFSQRMRGSRDKDRRQ